MPRSCLIGYSGFVGSTLCAEHRFTDVFRSTTINAIRGRAYELLVCAGASASKWQANQNPGADLAAINGLVDNLAEVQVRRLILISTVDVYAITRDVDESVDCSVHNNHAYGKNRLHLETSLRSIFPEVFVVRLPGLFGRGLKKNVIYDLLHDNCLQAINPESVFQYYDLARLWRDLQSVQSHGLPLVNLTTEPIAIKRVLKMYFPDKTVGQQADTAAFYDVRSRYAHLLGGSDGYRFTALQVLDQLGRFIDQTKRGVA